MARRTSRPAPADPTNTQVTKADGPVPVSVSDPHVDVLVPNHTISEVANLLLDKAEELGHDIERDVVYIGNGFRVRKSTLDAVKDELPAADAQPEPPAPVEAPPADAPTAPAPVNDTTTPEVTDTQPVPDAQP